MAGLSPETAPSPQPAPGRSTPSHLSPPQPSSHPLQSLWHSHSWLCSWVCATPLFQQTQRFALNSKRQALPLFYSYTLALLHFLILPLFSMGVLHPPKVTPVPTPLFPHPIIFHPFSPYRVYPCPTPGLTRGQSLLGHLGARSLT